MPNDVPVSKLTPSLGVASLRSIKEVGVEVVICGGTISDMALHFLNKRLNSRFSWLHGHDPAKAGVAFKYPDLQYHSIHLFLRFSLG